MFLLIGKTVANCTSICINDFTTARNGKQKRRDVGTQKGSQPTKGIVCVHLFIISCITTMWNMYVYTYKILVEEQKIMELLNNKSIWQLHQLYQVNSIDP